MTITHDYINGRTFWYTYKTVVDGSQTLYSDELAEVLVASTMAGERTPANFTSMETFVNDPDGNTISRTNSAGTVTYDWDDFNNLLAVKLDTGEVTQHLYGSDSIRKERVRDNEERVKSYYAGMSTSNESSTNASGNASYLMGHQLLGLERNGNFLYFVSDGLSSVRAVLDDQGDVVSTFEHDEYGNEMSMTGLPSPKTYVGGLGVHNDVGDTGLLYMRRRHYDPTLGRFLSADPIGLAGGLNVYEYAGANPVTRVDPTGLHDVILYLPQQDVNELNRILGTWITREQIRQDIESRLRNFLDCDQIDVKLKDYHLDFENGNPSEKRPFTNLHLSSAHLWTKDERGWFSPGGSSNPHRARVSAPGLRADRDRRMLSAEAISNIARNVIAHEAIGHALGKIGGSHSTGLWGPYIDYDTFSKSILDFDKDFTAPENSLLRRKLKMNIGCSH